MFGLEFLVCSMMSVLERAGESHVSKKTIYRVVQSHLLIL